LSKTTEKIVKKIETVGLGEWAGEHGYDGDDDPKLRVLCETVTSAMESLSDHIKELTVKHEIK
jgi:hypothetical protein